MNRTSKIAAAVIRWTLALLCIVGGSGASAWMLLDADDGEDER
jgi:hypothetical protein